MRLYKHPFEYHLGKDNLRYSECLGLQILLGPDSHVRSRVRFICCIPPMEERLGASQTAEGIRRRTASDAGARNCMVVRQNITSDGGAN